MAEQAGTTFDPKGKTFKERLNAFLAGAQATYSLTVKTDKGRTEEWQHRLQICHMFLYNKYTNTKPANTDIGKRTISWSHLSDASVSWATVSETDILRTTKGLFPVKTGREWKGGFEPDQDSTEKQAKKLLTDAGIGNSGQAMVSAGLRPCGEPCKCGASRSKHLDGEAADLNRGDLDALTAKLAQARAGNLDSYLKTFGLHRPLVNHPTSPEKWHVEAIP